MRPETLTLRGILAFHDERTLDYRNLPPGLIAFTGPNGAGKTTLMESPIAAVYRMFPSREKELYDYATRSDAFIEHTFELEGRGLFRARLNLDGHHRKGEAVLSQIGADGRITVLNDGKLQTFDTAIKDLLPRYEDLLASVFAAQTRKGSFSELDKKDRRILFASLLGLDRYQQLAERAGQAAARLERESEVLIAQRDVLARSVTASIESSLEQRAQQLQIEAGSVDVARAGLTAKIAEAEVKLAQYQGAIELHAKAVSTVTQIEARISNKTTEGVTVTQTMARMRAEADGDLRRLRAALATATARFEQDVADTSEYDRELSAITARETKTIQDAQDRIQNNRGLIDRKTVIEAAVARLVVIDEVLAENELVSREHFAQMTGYQKRERVLLDAVSVITQKQVALTRAEKDAAAIAAAPFGEQCAPCQFMTAAATAKAQIPGLQEAIAAKPTAEAELATVRAWLDTAHAANQDAVAARVALQKERDGLKPLADKAAPLALAEERIRGREREIVDAGTAAALARADAGVRRDERVARLTLEQEARTFTHAEELAVVAARTETRRTELQRQAADLMEALDLLEHQLDTARAAVLVHAESAGKATEQQTLVAVYRRDWDATTATKARVEAEIADLHRQRQVFATAKVEYEAVHARIEGFLGDVVEWQLLAKSLGRDGIQTLEIDAAGPTVSAYANDLSEHCAGGRFTFELVTQAPKATKGKDGSTTKEVFDVNIYDQRRGGERRDIGDLSGGERVIAEEILRSAIALLVSQRTTLRMRTLWRDECAGALDGENASQYVAMLRRLIDLGGYHHVLMVTHSPDVAQMADAQVLVENGNFEIAYPPYVTKQIAEAVA